MLIGLSLAVAALASVPLYFQQVLINGLAYGISLHQVMVLGAQYAAVTLLAIALKLYLQYRGAMLGETIVRRIRGRILATYAHKRHAGDATRAADGTIVSMLTAEAESVGLFAGEAITTPLLEFGTLLSVLIYITASEPLLGAIIVAVALPQAVIVVAVQRPVNPLVKKRLELLRRAVDRTIDSANPWPEATILDTFDGVLHTRQRIHILKLSSKAALNALAALGVVGILVLGGWLVLQGKTDVGTVVAALSGLTRIDRPWKNLIKFYRSLSTVLVRYGMLADAIA
ncbi:ABC transporter transmembrane domain-containing protein [Microvirga sp. 2YAF29]|uniref:ABC transporter transmembrane domain-containing protein n=1 Tax=Microvirga sp. 2YAF29 TaxID=3233031 RepID=UPI003F98337B